MTNTRKALTILLAAVAMFAGAPIAAAPAPAAEEPTRTTPSAWVAAEFAEEGVTPHWDVEYRFTDVGNCGSEISPNGTGGGCTEWTPTGPLIFISPSIIGTPEGEHILWHEYAHATQQDPWHPNECAAERFADRHTETTISVYICEGQ